MAPSFVGVLGMILVADDLSRVRVVFIFFR